MLPKLQSRSEEPRTLTSWNPFDSLPLLQRQMNGLIESFFGRDSRMPDELQQWSPSSELTESPTELTLSVELPGVDEKDVTIEVVGNHLAISGERKVENTTQDRRIHRTERWYGRFQRDLPLPAQVEIGKITAKFDKGVLTVHLPKKPGDKAIQIPIAKG